MQKVAGLHISGSNSKKTAVAIFNVQDGKMTSLKLYEKIGSFGSVFSEDRIKQILELEKPLKGVYFDCPLYLTPCLECVLPYCPGVVRCEDVGVATLLARVIQDKRKGAKKLRPLNPQSARVWDVTVGKGIFAEPTFSPTWIPVSQRARIIIKMFNPDSPLPKVGEISVPHALTIFANRNIVLKKDVKMYKNFEAGQAARARIMQILAQNNFLDEKSLNTFLLTNHLESFQAVLTALVGGLDLSGMTEEKPAHHLPAADWVVLPKFSLPP